MNLGVFEIVLISLIGLKLCGVISTGWGVLFGSYILGTLGVALLIVLLDYISRRFR